MSSSIERYSRAITSSNLKVTDKPGDVDALIAAGWIRDGLATMLYRLRVEFDLIDRTTPVISNCPATARRLVLMNCRGLPLAREALGRFVMAQATRAGLETTAEEQLRLAGRILDLFLDPRCETCHGVKFREVPGTGRLSGVPCGSCDGSGTRKMRLPGASYAEVDFTRSVQDSLARKMDHLGMLMRRFLR